MYNNVFDLIISDIMMPGIDGFEICKQIREKKNTPILMVSAKKDDIDKILYVKQTSQTFNTFHRASAHSHLNGEVGSSRKPGGPVRI